MATVKRYEGVNHELLCDVVCDILDIRGFKIELSKKNYHAGEKTGLKVYISGKRKKGWFTWEKVDASIIGQLDSETVFSIWGETQNIEKSVTSELSIYFQKMEVPELVS